MEEIIRTEEAECGNFTYDASEYGNRRGGFPEDDVFGEEGVIRRPSIRYRTRNYILSLNYVQAQIAGFAPLIVAMYNNDLRRELLDNALRRGTFAPQLESILAGLPQVAGKVVAFGSNGNIFGFTAAVAQREDFECYQMVAMRAVQRVLSDRHPGREIPCFVQDRFYRAAESHSHPVQPIHYVDDPTGILEVDETAVVVVTAPERELPVVDIIADVALTRPAAILCERLSLVPTSVRYPGLADPPGERMLRLEYKEHVPPEGWASSSQAAKDRAVYILRHLNSRPNPDGNVTEHTNAQQHTEDIDRGAGTGENPWDWGVH
ncbi:uncharacterized protein B0T15DRAFT_572142 [Chaetomium strumarium]|uniref:SRR1-like domain-containing protein n=1 Tax=Chaetomium strumarium TaxID=1170767 RepID=A0AAJ0M3N3_9PEZI|nr:hypothetical protein B0T15DRAFT_572142 [Chaetomium strumarium]